MADARKMIVRIDSSSISWDTTQNRKLKYECNPIKIILGLQSLETLSKVFKKNPRDFNISVAI